jgi:hypothetical protein
MLEVMNYIEILLVVIFVMIRNLFLLGISVNLTNSVQIFKLEKKSMFIRNEEVRLYFSEKNRSGKLWKGYIY